MEQFLPKLILVVVFVVLCQSVAVLAAADFRLRPTTRNIPERGKVPSMTFLAEGGRYSFIPPAGWRAGSKPSEKRLVLQSRHFEATMELRFLARESRPAGTLSPEVLRRMLAARYEAMVPLKEYDWTSSLGEAYGFELEIHAHGHQHALRRSIFIEGENHWLEFSITGRPDKFAENQRAFEMWMASVRRE